MVQIVDHRGNPIQTNQLAEPQTARYQNLQREFAGHPSRGLTPAKLASILREAEDGNLIAQHELWLDMLEKDGHIFSEMQKRQMAVKKLDWQIMPPRKPSDEEKAQAALLEELIRDNFDMPGLVLDTTDAIGHGFACIEYDGWGDVGSYRLPQRPTHRPQGWFQLDWETRTEIRLRDGSASGAPLNPFGWISHVHRSKSGYIGRGGLVRVLAWPYLFKNYSVRDLAEFLEIYGLPVGLGKYPNGASEKEKATLLKALLSIGHNARGIIPEGMAIEFEAAAEGGSDPFVAMINWCEASESKAILGGTLTSQAGEVGSHSLGQVHDDIRKDIRDDDAGQVGQVLTRDLVYPVAALNNLLPADPSRRHRLVFDTGEPEDLKLYSEALPNLVDRGVMIPVSWVREKLRIPAPDGNEPVLQAMGQVAPIMPPKVVANHAHAGGCCPPMPIAALAAQYPDQAAIDAALAALTDGQLQGQMATMLRPVLALAQSQPEQLLERLAGLYPEMDDSALVEQLARVMFVAETWGRLNG